jgi:hypothetical protein
MKDKQKQILRDYWLARLTQNTTKGLRLIVTGNWVEMTTKLIREMGFIQKKVRFSDIVKFTERLNERSRKEGKI